MSGNGSKSDVLLDIDAVISPIMLSFGILCNTIWIILLARHLFRHSVNSKTPMVMALSLAICDGCWVIFAGIGWFILHTSKTSSNELGGYTYFIFVETFFERLSHLLVVAAGIERFLAIQTPFFYEKYNSNTCLIKLFLVCSIYSLLFASIRLMSDIDHYTSVNKPIYRPNFSNGASDVRILYDGWTLCELATMLIILTVCNITVIRCLRILRERLVSSCPRNLQGYLKQKDMVKGIHASFSYLLVVITIVLAVTSIPYQVRIICNRASVWPSETANYIASTILRSTPTINPLVYIFYQKSVRNRIKPRLPCFQKVHPMDELTV
ncbi:prostaglandin E2 receptor EP2 subtype-like [Antedon mediterranea]|uniref:prostaglandin E2 receptor EP2 subtype-like n=1 Tax=Antedon mediterranea TaxID=105859 RepID=UPI003AF8050D